MIVSKIFRIMGMLIGMLVVCWVVAGLVLLFEMVASQELMELVGVGIWWLALSPIGWILGIMIVFGVIRWFILGVIRIIRDKPVVGSEGSYIDMLMDRGKGEDRGDDIS